MGDKQRWIPRPNHIPPEEWQQMSRDTKVAHWVNEQQKRKQTKPTMSTHLERYEERTITFDELFYGLCRAADVSQVDEFVERCDKELLNKICAELSKIDVDSYFSVQAVVYAPWCTVEEIEEGERERVESERRGIRLLRSALLNK